VSLREHELPEAPASEAPVQPGERTERTDPRLGRVDWPMPSVRAARRRSLVMALLCLPLAVWYLSWLLQGHRVGEPVLFGLLVAAEAFNLVQALGFWWTCSRQRLRGGRPITGEPPAVDVLIPVYDEPASIVEPTLAAASELRGAEVTVWLLDDGARPEMAVLAGRYGSGYLRRRKRAGAKAGNLNHALARTEAPYVVVLDCDHVPHIDFLERTLGHLEPPDVAFVQTPQYYANAAGNPVCSAAAAQQNLFFGPISRGKDGLGAMMCCGTNVVFRREALDEVGGFPEASLTEDFLLSVRLQERGWKSAYVSEVVASGLGPEDMASYVSQQQRWARGCLSAIPAVLGSRLPWRARAQYLLSATYFLSGWTLALYMSLPVLRLLFGIQPLASITASQFLIHFAPYYCGALAAVALAGSGTYTFAAFALSACSFWIHVQATLGALLRRAARFVVTPKRGELRRQPAAVAPALLAVGVLVSASAYGLTRGHGPATLNNVAFAALHSSILLIGAMPALRLRPSPLLVPDEPVPRRRSRRRRPLPRPVFLVALGVVLLVPVLLSTVGTRALRIPASLNQQAYRSVHDFLTTYVARDGRVVRRDQGGDTVSEGQAYGMLLGVAMDDRARFDSIWSWTRTHLEQPNGLLASRWTDGRVASNRPAADADLDAAQALVLASERFGHTSYRDQGVRIARAVLHSETMAPAASSTALALVAGPWARNPIVVNPSYFSPRAYADLARADHHPRWRLLVSSSRSIVAQLTMHGLALPPDWATIGGAPASGASSSPLSRTGATAGGVRPIGDPGAPSAAVTPTSSFDAIRLAVRYAASCSPADRRLAAALWPIYRRNPGRDTYALDGAPASPYSHAVSFVGAAAAARAAGDRGSAARLLARAQAENDLHPSYYGAAWVALGRVMLTTAALGGCVS
jgi:cellulose synthase/poly-beta-1,6-N-acetylglucosamine synthase-like glycosyltransferase